MYDETLTIGLSGDKTNLKVSDVKLIKNPNDTYSLDVKYLLETSETIREFHFPSIQLPLTTKQIQVGIVRGCFGQRHYAGDIDVGFGYTTLNVDPAGNAYYERIIETKTKEMTLEEIEKKLGHKVKIVNKK